jgi:3-oxoacyl-[acyl-carrier protein] reductase
MPQSSRRVALVTGGGRGIGLGVSQALAKDGFDLAFCGMREPSAVVSVVDDLRRLGGRVE